MKAARRSLESEGLINAEGRNPGECTALASKSIYTKPLRKEIQEGCIEPSAIISHHLELEDAPEAYKMFRNKQDGCVKLVMRP